MGGESNRPSWYTTLGAALGFMITGAAWRMGSGSSGTLLHQAELVDRKGLDHKGSHAIADLRSRLARDWGPEDVSLWLDLGAGLRRKHRTAFAGVTGAELLSFTPQDLMDVAGPGLTVPGATRVAAALQRMDTPPSTGTGSASAGAADAPSPEPLRVEFDIPKPSGWAETSGRVMSGIDERAGQVQIPPECITIMQVIDSATGFPFDDIAADSLLERVRLATTNGWGKASNTNEVGYALGVAMMHLYAKRHGHGYRLVVNRGNITAGPTRPDRHPAWARVALLWSVYSGARGAEKLLAEAPGGKTCAQEDQWLLYVDTDIAITSSHSIGEIFEAMRVRGWHHGDLPCSKRYGEAGEAYAEAKRTGTPFDPGFCHLHPDLGATKLTPGVDTSKSIGVAVFNDGDWWNGCENAHRQERVNSSAWCPDPVHEATCTGIMLWRVPNLHKAEAADTPSGDPKAWTAAGAGIDAGRRMVDTWRKSRLAPPKVLLAGEDAENFLAVGWAKLSELRVSEVYRPNTDETACQQPHCGFASDQPVFNRAVVFGIPHRPYKVDDPKSNVGIGRFLKHMVFLRCDHCNYDAYSHGEPFLHATGLHKEHRLPNIMIKLLHELYGLELLFAWAGAAGDLARRLKKPPGNVVPWSKHVHRALKLQIDHDDPAKQTLLRKRMENCLADHDREITGPPCVDRPASEAAFKAVRDALADVKQTQTLLMRPNPRFMGVDDDTHDWYSIEALNNK